MESPSFAPAAFDDPDAAASLQSYYAELDRVFPEGFDPDAWAAITPDETRAPTGCFILMRHGDETIGCGAVKTLSQGVGEIKRMWIRDDMRGRGLGPKLLAELEAQARKLGHVIVRLDTSAHLPIAIAMYKKHGYTEIEPYNDNPYAAHWFEKPLNQARSPTNA
ncbi:MAG: GNAT family N-acetyltransferase [Acidimicrobiia bacterium]|nr:GNAT family N-acetyltransferase [Acidimicrobiia bacterium]